jgi:hypothetical protein
MNQQVSTAFTKAILHLGFVLFLSVTSLYSQKQANFWYFGLNCGLNFSSGLPLPILDGALSTGEGCSAISTVSGQLQFYTDGTYVYDRQNNQMPNGFDLHGNSSSTQSGLIVPIPGSTTQYYIFTVDAWEHYLDYGLCYTRVDMTLNFGFGDVLATEKNVTLIINACEKVSAVGHSDGSGIWVITHLWDSDAFYAYLVTTDGIDTNPVISHAGPWIGGNMETSKGYLKVSPDGTKIAIANNIDYTVGIYNFNNTTGIITHLVTDSNYVNPGGENPGGPYGVEFSPNSQRLFISGWKLVKKIFQYDLSSGDPETILTSRWVVAQGIWYDLPYGALQLGPDNRIYVARDGVALLSRINFPNVFGFGCEYEDLVVDLGGRSCRYGLPPFIQSFFKLTVDYFWDTPTCNSVPIQFYTNASEDPDSVKWNFGDPASGPENASTLLNPQHLYPATGNYWVTLLVYLHGIARNVFHIITINEPPEVFLGNDTTICISPPYILDAGPGYSGYLWQNGSTDQTIEVSESGLFWCRVTGAGGCTAIDSIYITVIPVPDVSAGPDQTIPAETSTSLNASVTGGSGNYNFHWQPEDKLIDAFVLNPQTVILSNTTLFNLTVTDNQGGCSGSDQTMVYISGGVLSCNPFAEPGEICLGGQSQLHAMASGGSGIYTYEWTSIPPGFNSDLGDPVISPLLNTDFSVTINDGFSLVTGNAEVDVHPLPVPEAGPDFTIPYGTAITLQGSAGSGSGTYFYHWEPENKLINPSDPQSTTIPLDASTIFTLSVTDAQTGCVCSEPDHMEVTVTGNTLSVNPFAQPDTICSGETTQLFAQASGGAGNQFYNFTWISDPPGFNSEEKNPYVQPFVNTIYTVVLDDGFMQVSDSVIIVVHNTPFIDLGPDTTVCVFDTLILDAGNPGSAYLWSNGSTERKIYAGTTGIAFSTRTIWVTVTSPEGCAATDYLTLVFDFAACTGISDPLAEYGFHIYPNPGEGLIHIENHSRIGNYWLSVTDIFGRDIIKNRKITFTSADNILIINIKSYSTGLYMVRILENDNNFISLKYLLNR